jgi:hypothetical protein
VAVAWRLIDIEGELTFDVSRRADSGSYLSFDDVAIASEGNGAFRFDDFTTEPGRRYTYRVVVLEKGEAVTSFETSVTTPTPQFSLDQNRPNPFNPTTKISFVIPSKVNARLAIFDVQGRLVRRLVDEEMPPGFKEVVWDGRSDHGMQAASGIYFYQLRAGKNVLTRKMVLMK